MSHQTGIRGNETLQKFFGKCRDGSIRVIKVSICEEELTLTTFKDTVGTWEEDYDRFMKPLIDPEVPCYVLYRLDSKNASGYDWMLLSWCPDSCSVRNKMLYASTKATLKHEFGSNQIKEDLHATSVEDVTLNGYRRFKSALSAPAPLTQAEEELNEMKRGEVGHGIDVRQQTLTGVQFPMTKTSLTALENLALHKIDYVQLEIDLTEEVIHMSDCIVSLAVDNLKGKVPRDAARYHLYNYKHTHEGDYQEAILFIYTMPGYNCSVRERMMYSSCKAPLIETIESHLGLVITKKIESDEPDELTEEFLRDQVHPQKMLHRPKFAKPKGPPNRGAKRLTRSNQED